MREKRKKSSATLLRIVLNCLVVTSVLCTSGCIYSVVKISKFIDSVDHSLTSKDKIIKYEQLDKYESEGDILITTDDLKFIISNINKPRLFYISDSKSYVNNYLFIEIENMPMPKGNTVVYKIPKIDGYTFDSLSILYAVGVGTSPGWISGKPKTVLNCNENKPYKISVTIWNQAEQRYENERHQEITVIPKLSDKYNKDLIECSPPGKYG